MDMAEEYLIILKQGVVAWNRFMQDHTYKVRADFRRANLAGMDLTKAVVGGIAGKGISEAFEESHHAQPDLGRRQCASRFPNALLVKARFVPLLPMSPPSVLSLTSS